MPGCYYKCGREAAPGIESCRTCADHYNAKARERRKRNPEASRAAIRKWASLHPEAIRANSRRVLLRKYGLTVVDFERLLARQGHRCAICGTQEPAGQGTWCVDHDHTTGAVRGLLCTNCNTSLKKHLTPELLRQMANYLENGGVYADEWRSVG